MLDNAFSPADLASLFNAFPIYLHACHQHKIPFVPSPTAEPEILHSWK